MTLTTLIGGKCRRLLRAERGAVNFTLNFSNCKLIATYTKLPLRTASHWRDLRLGIQVKEMASRMSSQQPANRLARYVAHSMRNQKLPISPRLDTVAESADPLAPPYGPRIDADVQVSF